MTSRKIQPMQNKQQRAFPDLKLLKSLRSNADKSFGVRLMRRRLLIRLSKTNLMSESKNSRMEFTT